MLIRVRTALYRAGILCPPGAMLDLRPEQAASLIAQGVAEAALPHPVPRVPEPAPAPVPPIPTLDDEQE